MNPKALGEKTEAILIAEFVKRDYKVLLPFGDNQRYDLVLDTNEGFKRVQCKTGRMQNGRILFEATSTRINTKGSYRVNYRGQIDYFAVYCYETGKAYLVPVDAVGIRAGSIRVDAPKKVNKTIMWAKDFEL